MYKKVKLLIITVAGISITACNSGTNKQNQPIQQNVINNQVIKSVDINHNLQNEIKPNSSNGDTVNVIPINGGYLQLSAQHGIRCSIPGACTPKWSSLVGHPPVSAVAFSFRGGNSVFIADNSRHLGYLALPANDEPLEPVNWATGAILPQNFIGMATDGQHLVVVNNNTIFINLGNGDPSNPFNWNHLWSPINLSGQIIINITYNSHNNTFFIIVRSGAGGYKILEYQFEGETFQQIRITPLPLDLDGYSSATDDQVEPNDDFPFNALPGQPQASGDSEIAISPDGISWQLEDTSITEKIIGATFGNGIKIAAGENGSVIQRANGKWSIIYSFNQPNFEVKSLIYTIYNSTTLAGNFILTVESNGEIETFTSEDGKNWFNTSIPTFSQVSSGVNTACGISSSNIYCWGSNEDHIMGSNYTAESVTIPVKIKSNYQYKSVSVGEHHACALRVGGIVDCWGSNASGQLGTNGSPNEPTPTQVAGRLTFRNVKVGDNHSCGVVNNGSIYCWGNNQYGQTGQNMNVFSVLTPQRVSDIYTVPNPDTGLALGSNHTCFNGLTIHENSTSSVLTYCFGSNTHGQLGIGGKSDVGMSTPRLVSRAFSQIDAGGNTTCGVDVATINAYCWGLNDRGQVGGGNYVPSEQLRPHPVVDANGKLYTFLRVSVGINHACGVDGEATPKLLCWGDDTYGELGIGAIGDYYPYASVVPAAITPDFAISLGGQFGIATDESKNDAFGLNNSGQLGLNTRNLESTLIQIN